MSNHTNPGYPSRHADLEDHGQIYYNSYTSMPSQYTSPTSNPHAGMHPSSYGRNISYTAAALGATSSNASSSLGMSISPPHWVPGSAPWASSGSFVGSLGALGTSFGRERDRELEATYVRDFYCCGRQLGGLHELLEHYEEEHANLAPDARMAALNAVQAGPPVREHITAASPSIPLQSQHGEVPTPPGMADIEMDEDTPRSSVPSHLMQQQGSLPRQIYPSSAPASPWASAFRPQGAAPPPQCLPPSLLSFNPAVLTPMSQNGYLPSAPSPIALTSEQLQAKALRKAERKAERAAAREEASASDAEGEKRFPCPIEGCGKVYKQANGLKYHLTRSINSGHGNVAAMGGLTQYLSDKAYDG